MPTENLSLLKNLPVDCFSVQENTLSARIFYFSFRSSNGSMGRRSEMSLNLDSIPTEFNLNVLSDSESEVYLFEEYRLDGSAGCFTAESARWSYRRRRSKP